MSIVWNISQIDHFFFDWVISSILDYFSSVYTNNISEVEDNIFLGILNCEVFPYDYK